jgi:electron transfer flavoprotein alpha subunit
MSVLVYAESWEGNFRKSTFEAISYASETAKLLSLDVIAISLGPVDNEELNKLGKYGASKVISFSSIEKGDSQSASNAISSVANESKVLVFSNTHTAKMIAPRLSVKLQAGIISNVIGLAESLSPLKLKRKSFSSKAIEFSSINSPIGIISIAPNSFEIIENEVNCLIKEDNSSKNGLLTIESKETLSGKISISEAEIVISAGRGLKGPENWGMIEELADLLGAATACSKPVSDIGWRPHDEHVGQTGKAVAADLYIAIGISGAIQHLAGVNSSKIMVAINTDPEAPFFKAADYGIVGDAFKIVPQLIKEIKQLKA